MKKIPHSFLILAVLFCAIFYVINLQAESTLDKLSEKKIDKNVECNVCADSSEYKLDSDWGVLSGNVIIEYGNIKLNADKIRFNRVTGDAEAEGNVVFTSDTGDVWRGDTLNVNVFKGLAQSSGFDFYSEPVRVIAAGGSILTDEENKKEYSVENAVITTCTNAPAHFHYHVKAKKLRVIPDEELIAEGAVSYLFGIPIFYWPFYWKDLNRHYGFRFEPGYSSDWGAFLLSSHKLSIYQNKETQTYFDSKTSIDVRSERGIAFGEKLEWEKGENFNGWFSAYFLHDNDRPEDIINKDRYRFRFENEWEVTDRDRIIAQALYVSDDRVMEDFFEEEYDQMNQPDTYFAWTHRGDAYSGGMQTRLRLNNFYTQTERLPEFWYNLNGTELFNTGFYLKNKSSFSYLDRDFDKRLGRASYDTLRLDSEFVLTRPIKLMGFLNVVPRVGYRGTLYEETLKNDRADYRSVFEIGTEISFKAFSTWADNDGFTWRHVIEPYADIKLIPEASLTPEELYQFDDIDEIKEGKKLLLGLRNRWQYKTNNPNATARELLYLDLYAVFNIDRDADEEDTFESFNFDLRYRPTSWLELDGEGVYEQDKSDISEALFRLNVWYDAFEASAFYRYINDEDSNLVGADFVWNINTEWAVSLYGRYEFDNSQLEEIGTWIQRKYDCLAYRIYFTYEPSYTRYDGIEEDEDFRISFILWLTDFEPKSLRELNDR